MTQFARPASDVTVTGFSATGAVGGVLATTIDEATYSSADFVYGNNGGGNTYETLLSSVGDPGVGTGHVVNFRYGRTDNGTLNGSGNAVDLTVGLYQGATLIASTVVACTGAWQAGSIALTSGQADSITDYANLRLRFSDSSNGGSPSGRRAGAVAWAELQVPDAVPVDPTLAGVSAGVASVSGALSATGGSGPTTYAADAFDKLESLGWADADVGGAWTGVGLTWSEDGSVGLMNPAAGGTMRANLLGVSAADSDTRVRVRFSEAISTASGVNVYVEGRYVSSSVHYRVRVQFTSANAVRLQLEMAGSAVSGGGFVTIARETFAPGTWFWVRFQIEAADSVTTNLRAKVWRDGTSEPATWDLEGVDGTLSLQDPVTGAPGLRAFTGSVQSPSGFYGFDDLTVTSIDAGGGDPGGDGLAGVSAGMATAGGSLTVDSPPAAAVITDTFNRTVSGGGLGTSDSGHVWDTGGIDAQAHWSADGSGVATVSVDDDTPTNSVIGEGVVEVTNARGTIKFRFRQIPPGNTRSIRLYSRRGVDQGDVGDLDADDYRHVIRLTSSGQLQLLHDRSIDASRVDVSAGYVTAVTGYVADDWYWAKWEVEGVNPAISLRTKIWKVGDTEPDWQLTDTDNPGSTGLDHGGTTGIHLNASTLDTVFPAVFQFAELTFGDLDAATVLAGASAGAAAVSGDLSTVGVADTALAGASGGVAAVSGDVTVEAAGAVPLAGAAAGAASVSGDLGQVAAPGTLLAGASAGAATASGTLVERVPLAGAAAGAAVVSGDLNQVGVADTALAGAAGGAAGASASLTVEAAGVVVLAGVAAGAASVSGDLNQVGVPGTALAGSSAGSSTAGAALTVTAAGPVALAGASAGAALVEATLDVSTPGVTSLAGVTGGTSSLSASLGVAAPGAVTLGGASVGQAAVGGALSVAEAPAVVLAGSAAGASTISAQLSVAVGPTALAGASAGAAAVVGQLAVAQALDTALAGATLGRAVVTAALSGGIPHSGSSTSLLLDSLMFWQAFDALTDSSERRALYRRFLLDHGAIVFRGEVRGGLHPVRF